MLFCPMTAHVLRMSIEQMNMCVQVRVLKDAGAVVLAKSNMAEWAFAPTKSIGSAFGIVRNPYSLDRVTAGSSGGSAAGQPAALLDCIQKLCKRLSMLMRDASVM